MNKLGILLLEVIKPSSMKLYVYYHTFILKNESWLVKEMTAEHVGFNLRILITSYIHIHTNQPQVLYYFTPKPLFTKSLTFNSEISILKFQTKFYFNFL